MEDSYDKSTLTSTVKQITENSHELFNLNSSLENAEQIDSIDSSAAFVRDEKGSNCPLLVEVKKEVDLPEDQSLAGSVENMNTSTLDMKVESEWNQFETKQVPDYVLVHNQDIIVPRIIDEVKSEPFDQIEEYLSDQILNNTYTSENVFPEQIEVRGKPDDHDTETRPEIVFDDLKTEHDDLKVEEFVHNQILMSPVRKQYGEYKRCKCHVCGYQTNSKSNLNKHVLRHKNPEEIDCFRCHQCEYQSRRKDHLKRHLVRHKNIEEDNTYKCSECSYQTIDKEQLKRHQLCHKYYLPRIEVNVLKCTKCDFTTISDESLRDHRKQHKNPDRRKYTKCNQCEYRTRRKIDLKRHQLRHINKEEADLFMCDKCDFNTIHKRSLDRHLLRHENPDALIT